MAQAEVIPFSVTRPSVVEKHGASTIRPYCPPGWYWRQTLRFIHGDSGLLREFVGVLIEELDTLSEDLTRLYGADSWAKRASNYAVIFHELRWAPLATLRKMATRLISDLERMHEDARDQGWVPGIVYDAVEIFMGVVPASVAGRHVGRTATVYNQEYSWYQGESD